MDIVHRISLDFVIEQNPPHISVMQGDSAREIRISLYSNGVAWIPSGSESAYIAFETPSGIRAKVLSLKDGTPVVSFADNVATIKLPPELTQNSGKIPTVLVILNGDGKQIATFPIAVSVVDNPASGSVEITIPDSGQNGNLTTAQINALDGMFKVCAFIKNDVSAEYNAFKTAFGISDSGGGEGPNVPDVPAEKTYNISNELVNVTSNNSATSVNENASYTATLTAADGYTLDSVIVTMGGVDVTSTVYADGVITISAVIGNVEIIASASVVKEAALITDGLLDYFDFRTAEYNNTDTGSKTTINSNIGNGWLYAWANNVVTEQSNYGIMKTTRALMYASDSTTTQTNLGTAFTWVFKSYLTKKTCPFTSSDYSTLNNTNKLNWIPKYKTASGTSQVSEVPCGNSVAGYDCVIITVDGSIARLYFGSELVAETDGSTIDGFVSWFDMLTANIIGGADHYITQLAVYNRALSEVEITETVEYLASLEVA